MHNSFEMPANVGIPTCWLKNQPNWPGEDDRERTALAYCFTHLHKLSVASCIALQKKRGKEQGGKEEEEDEEV